MKDPYSILGVNKNATDEEIKDAYRELARKYHPDNFSDDAMKELAEEYGVPYLFSDFKKRNGYKRSIELSREYGLYRQDYCGCVFSKREREMGGSAP